MPTAGGRYEQVVIGFEPERSALVMRPTASAMGGVQVRECLALNRRPCRKGSGQVASVPHLALLGIVKLLETDHDE